MRYRCYKRQKWHYFFLDQCYWVHSALIVGSVVRFDDAAFLQTLFAVSNGPILLAIFMWKNSLALHDFDKATSTFLHLMPGAVTWCWRWFGHERAAALWGAPSSPRLVITAPDGRGGPQGGSWPPDVWGLFCRPLACYCVWQLVYFVKTEVLDKEIIAADPELMTCQRWISTRSSWLKHPYVEWCGRCLVLPYVRGRGKGARGEGAVSGALVWSEARDSRWAGVVYTAGNFVYESVTLLIALPLYQSYHLHTFALTAGAAYTVWNAGTWYTDRFPAMLAAAAEAHKSKAG